jgi:predicted FMN-binding regulatory protein PaiB
MSQNRSEADRAGVAGGLAESDLESDRRVATMIPH